MIASIDLRNFTHNDMCKIEAILGLKRVLDISLFEAKKIFADNVGNTFTVDLPAVNIEYAKKLLYPLRIPIMAKEEFKEKEVVKVGNVFILTEEKYKELVKCKSILLDLFGTVANFKKAYEDASTC